MKNIERVLSFTLASLLLAAVGAGQGQTPQQPAVSPSVWAAPPAPAGQASSAFQSACGSQPMCYDAPDFAVAVVDFRMSATGGYKVMDATLRFVNKTNQPLILGYLDNSAVALDDQGNRYGPYGNRGLAGIGLVLGNSADPKFVLQPGGAGDARWELLWRPGPQDPIGSAFELGMTIREINTIAGGQHTLGAEVPLRFQGLANGAVGTAMPAAAATAPVAGVAGAGGIAGASSVLAGNTSSGLPPCGTAGSAAGTLNNIAGAANSVGGQQAGNAAANATNTAGNAMAQLSSLKSIFGRKKAASAPAANVAGAAPCIPAANGAAMPVVAGTSTASATAGQVGAATPAATAATSAPGAGGKTAAATAAIPAKTPAATAAGARSTASAAGSAAKAPAAPPVANTTKPAVVQTVAPNTKPAVRPATAPVSKPAAPANKPAATAPTAKKPAATTPPAKQ